MHLVQLSSTDVSVKVIVLILALGVGLPCRTHGQDTKGAQPFFRPALEALKTPGDQGYLLKVFTKTKDVDDIETWSAWRFNELAFELEARRDEEPGVEALNRAQLCAERALDALLDMPLDNVQRQKRLAEYLDMTLSILKDSKEFFATRKITQGDYFRSRYLYANAKLALLRSQQADSAAVPDDRQKD